MNDILDTLPRLAQDYTPEQRWACVQFLANLPLEDLRRRQSIKSWEIGEAVRRGLPEEIILDLREKDEQLYDAESLWIDKKNKREGY